MVAMSSGDSNNIDPSDSLFVSSQRQPQRIVVFADAHEAAKAHDSVSDLAIELVDHDPLDLADSTSIRTVDRGSFHLIAADQACGLAPVEGPALRIYSH